MTLPSPRLLNIAGALMCAGLMGYALYAQHFLYLDPCPLCVFQRLAVIALGVLFLLAALHNPGPTGRKVYGGLLGIAAVAGVTVAAWHVYLQSLPPEKVPGCGPGFDYIVENLPFTEALALIFKGSGECADVSWRFLTLSMPTWVLIACAGLGIAAIWNNFRSQQ